LALVIIAGAKKGLKLDCPPSDIIRPTAAIVREALFSMLGDKVTGASVLDLFAGTGAMGLEAVSRGAKSAVLCDREPEVLVSLKRNAARFREGFDVKVAALSFPQGMTALKRLGTFDMVFLDPPYDQPDMAMTFLARAPGLGILVPGATAVWEMSPRTLKTIQEAGTGTFKPVTFRAWGQRAAAILEYPGE
jgi:16S rRNA (guanine966-N2)-methyltransferase